MGSKKSHVGLRLRVEGKGAWLWSKHSMSASNGRLRVGVAAGGFAFLFGEKPARCRLAHCSGKLKVGQLPGLAQLR